jgi:hypothetical protein
MINLAASISFFYIILFFIVIGFFTYFIYRITIPDIPRGKKIFLIALRTLSFSIILFLIFEPLLTLIRKSEEKPVLTVLIDNSKSMSVTDKAGNRIESLRKIFESGIFNEINKYGDVKFVTFSDKARLYDDFKIDSLNYSGNITDLSRGIKDLKKLFEDKNMSSLLVISDGEYNSGQNPVYQAELFGKQINTIGIGDSSEQKDLGISKIFTNNIVYKGTKIPVNVILKSSGFQNEAVSVSLQYEGKTIDTKKVDLKPGTAEYNIDFIYEPQEEGIKKYGVSVSVLSGEITDKNNRKPFFVKVLKNKLKVTIIAGAPTHDVSFVKNALIEDGNIEVKTFVQKADGDFYEGALDTKQLEESECIYLIGFPQSNSKQNVIEAIKNTVSAKNKPLFFIADLNLDYSKLKTLEPFLPFTVKQINNNEILVNPSINSSELRSPLMNLSGTEEDLNTWNNLPPLFRTETNFEKKAESEVLATLKINNIPFNYPLILTRKVYKQKSLAITGYGVWRWKLLAEGLGGSADFLKMFTGNSVRWLTTREEDKKFKVVTSKEIYNSGEPVEFMAELYDDSYQPIDDAAVKVAVQKGTESYETVLDFIGTGRYSGNMEGLSEGDYRFSATALKGDTKIGDDNGRFSVGESNLEFNNLRMNAQLLKQISSKTGGDFYTLNDFQKVVDKIKNDKNFVPTTVIHKSEFQLWNIYYVLAIIILLLAFEWFIRKKSGMM